MTPTLCLQIGLFLFVMGIYAVALCRIAFRESQPEIEAHAWLAETEIQTLLDLEELR